MQTTRNEIIQKLKDVFKMAVGNTNYDESKYAESSNLTTDLGLNSVGILYVVIAIEEFFSIQFGSLLVQSLKKMLYCSNIGFILLLLILFLLGFSQ